MIRRPPRSTLSSSSAASDVYKRQGRPNGCAAAEVAGRTGPAAGRTGPGAGRTGPGAGRAGRVDSGLDRAAGRVGNPAGQELAELLPAAELGCIRQAAAAVAAPPVRPQAG